MTLLQQLLAPIFALATSIYGFSQQIYNTVKQLLDLAGGVPYGPNTQTTVTVLQDPTSGLAALYALIVGLQSDLDTSVAEILLAIGTPQQAGSAVTLPTTTPSGGAWVDLGNVGSSIWNFTDPPGDITPYQYVKLAGSWVDFQNVDGQGPPIDWLFYANDYQPIFDDAWAVTYPSDDPSTIAPSDTLLTWLTGQNPTATVTWFGGVGAQVQVHFSTGSDVETFLTKIIDADFQLLKSFIFPSTPVQTPPVWPGLAGVTLGTPIALATGVTVPGPLDGVLVEITSVPSYTGLFDFDGDPSYRNVGGITFQTDNGQDELPQTLGFASAVYCPRAMTRAVLAKVRTPGAIVGTVTPWVRT